MLKINEIFCSIQGESSFAGLPFVFVRLTGCNLRCNYCDTQYAYDEGEFYSVDEIVKKVRSFEIPRVCVTGGEPLFQAETLELLSKFCNLDFLVTLETNGHHPISEINKGVRIILDVKTPGSGMSEKNYFDNLHFLKQKDEVKFVITDRNDYNWANDVISKHNLTGISNVLLSPCSNTIEHAELASWILEDKLDCRLNLQLHKIIWGNMRGK